MSQQDDSRDNALDDDAVNDTVNDAVNDQQDDCREQMAAMSVPGAARDAADGGASCVKFQRAIEFIGRRWVGAILFVLLEGPARFNELLASVPNLSDRLLAERLRELETAGLVTREVLPGPPVKVVYELTDAGRALSGIIHGLSDWAHEWMPDR